MNVRNWFYCYPLCRWWCVYTEPKKWAMIFATVLYQYETNFVSPVGTRFQRDIQSLASSALLLPTPPWQLGGSERLEYRPCKVHYLDCELGFGRGPQCHKPYPENELASRFNIESRMIYLRCRENDVSVLQVWQVCTVLISRWMWRVNSRLRDSPCIKKSQRWAPGYPNEVR
jgi:hypothetical protein